MDKILELLYEQQDEQFAMFQGKLMPGVAQENIIGVRTPDMRKLAKTVSKMDEKDAFLANLPHKYFDENQLHSFLLCEIKDFDECVKRVNEFLPYIDNWATCDQLSPKVFKKNPERLLEYIPKWISSDKTYTIRFGIGMLMQFFLDDLYEKKYLDQVARIESDEYYVNMEIAWYLATALAKQWKDTIKLIESKSLNKWVQNKTIQKAIESYRITDEQKAYLRTLKL